MEQKKKCSRLTITAGKEKSPKPVENKGLWTLVPVTGLDLHFAPMGAK